MRKNVSHWAIQILQNDVLISSPLSGKIRLLFAIFGIFLPGKRAVSQVKRKFDKYYFIHTIPGQLPVKKNFVQIFSSFAVIDHKGHFRKILTRIFKFGWFSWYHSYMFLKFALLKLKENLKLNRLAPVSNPKNEKL